MKYFLHKFKVIVLVSSRVLIAEVKQHVTHTEHTPTLHMTKLKT